MAGRLRQKKEKLITIFLIWNKKHPLWTVLGNNSWLKTSKIHENNL